MPPSAFGALTNWVHMRNSDPWYPTTFVFFPLANVCEERWVVRIGVPSDVFEVTAGKRQLSATRSASETDRAFLTASQPMLTSSWPSLSITEEALPSARIKLIPSSADIENAKRFSASTKGLSKRSSRMQIHYSRKDKTIHLEIEGFAVMWNLALTDELVLEK
jgi:hypothetical protein